MWIIVTILTEVTKEENSLFRKISLLSSVGIKKKNNFYFLNFLTLKNLQKPHMRFQVDPENFEL